MNLCRYKIIMVKKNMEEEVIEKDSDELIELMTALVLCLLSIKDKQEK